jgi:DNA-binding IclR family transcriptional regulator
MDKDAKIGGAQAIKRAITLLRAVAAANERGARASVLAAEMGLSVATAHRILSVLAEEGLLTHDPYSKLYHLGMELFVLGAAAQQFSIRDRLRPVLDEVARDTEDTVFLLIRSGNDAVCIDRVEGSFPIRTLTLDIGARRPLGIGAGGLALLAYLPDEQVAAVLAANAARYASYAGFGVEDIRRAVAETRELGYAPNSGLLRPNVIAVGVPVPDSSGRIAAAISVAAIPERLPAERREQIAETIVHHISRIGPLADAHA